MWNENILVLALHHRECCEIRQKTRLVLQLLVRPHFSESTIADHPSSCGADCEIWNSNCTPDRHCGSFLCKKLLLCSGNESTIIALVITSTYSPIDRVVDDEVRILILRNKIFALERKLLFIEDSFHLGSLISSVGWWLLSISGLDISLPPEAETSTAKIEIQKYFSSEEFWRLNP